MSFYYPNLLGNSTSAGLIYNKTMLWRLPIRIALAASAAFAATLDVETMLRIQRISDPQLSPDGKTVAFAAQRVDLAANKKTSQIYVVSLDGSAPKPLTTEGSNDRPRWSPDSKRLLFISDRAGSSQVWAMNADGSSQKQVTKLATEASGVLPFPDGKRILFLSEVYPECNDEACNERMLKEEKEAKSKARVYTSLLYRHWNTYQSKRRSHLMMAEIGGGSVKDLTPGRFDVPTFSLGGQDGYAISPDSKEICYVMNGENDQALSTNSELWTVSPESGEPRKITVTAGADVGPVYSPDGQWLAWRGQKTAGYESDRWRLFLIQRSSGRVRDLTETLDRSVQSISWSPDSTRVFFTVEDRGRQGIQMFAVNGTGGARSIVSGSATYDDVQLSPDGKTMIYTMQTGSKPVEIFKVNSADNKPVPLAKLNDAVLSGLTLPAFEDINANGAEGAKVHSFVLKPPDFDPKQKYPVLFFIHGGPQGAWHESWSYRWNPQIFAAAGFVVVMPNHRRATSRRTDDVIVRRKDFEESFRERSSLLAQSGVRHRLTAAGLTFRNDYFTPSGFQQFDRREANLWTHDVHQASHE